MNSLARSSRRFRPSSPLVLCSVALLVASALLGTPVGLTFGYALQEGPAGSCSLNPYTIQSTLYQPYNRDTMQFWYNLVEEAAFTNVSYLAMNFRGDSPCGGSPAGNEPTSFASNIVNALNTRGYTNILKVSMFDDTGSYPPAHSQCGGGSTFDVGDSSLWQPYFWDTRWKPFFQQVPDANRMKINNRPLIFMWSVASGLGFTNQGNGHLAALMDWLRARCQAEFGFDPFVVVDVTWLQLDPTVASKVDGVNDWFQISPPGTPWSKHTHNGHSGTFTTGVVNGGFWYPPANMFTSRGGGATLSNGLANMSGTDLVLIEGLTDIEENAGLYRGGHECQPACGSPYPPPAGQCWTSANQYLNRVRQYTAPFPKYVIFEAEAADSWVTLNQTGSGLYRRSDPLNIVYTDGAQSQWAVVMNAGESLDFSTFDLGSSSTYRVGVRYASAGGARAALYIDGVQKATIPLVTTGSFGTYKVYTLGQNLSISQGTHTIRFKVTNGHAVVDQWILNGFAPPANPTVVSISPTSGPAAGGTALTVVGQGYVSGATAKIGGVSATGVTVQSATQLSATTPARLAGTLNDVTITNPDGLSSTLARGFLADFADVSSGNQFHAAVETLFRDAVTAGCGSGIYCPDSTVINSQMAVFLLKGLRGSLYTPPPATGTVFADVPRDSFAAAWIEELHAEGISSGCGGGLFCPNAGVLRRAMAKLLLRAKHGSSYVPPPAQGIFGDVPIGDPDAPWIEQLFNEGITGGCGGGNYCPNLANTRGQMSVFIAKTFDLQ